MNAGLGASEPLVGRSRSELEAVAAECHARSERTPDGIYIYTSKDCEELERAIRPCCEWLRRPANLEDLFIKLTGRTLHES